jgi:hypothetical protein
MLLEKAAPARRSPSARRPRLFQAEAGRLIRMEITARGHMGVSYQQGCVE